MELQGEFTRGQMVIERRKSKENELGDSELNVEIIESMSENAIQKTIFDLFKT